LGWANGLRGQIATGYGSEIICLTMHGHQRLLKKTCGSFGAA